MTDTAGGAPGEALCMAAQRSEFPTSDVLCRACGSGPCNEGYALADPHDPVQEADLLAEWIFQRYVKARPVELVPFVEMRDRIRSALVARAREADRLEKRVRELEELVQCLVDNDPDDLIADGGHTVLSLWRHDARRLLARTDEPADAR